MILYGQFFSLVTAEDEYSRNEDLVHGATNVVVLESLGTSADIPSTPTIRPVIIELEAHLANSDIESAIRLCQSLESSSAPSMDDKQVGWHHILEYMDQQDMLFDPPAATDSNEDGPDQALGTDSARTFQLPIRQMKQLKKHILRHQKLS